MATMHEAGAEKLARRWLGDPNGALVLHKAHRGVTRYWEHGYVAALGQKDSRAGDWQLGQIASFGALHVDIQAGAIGIVKVRAGGEPRRDSAREANAAHLADLPEPFAGEVYMDQHNGDSDGKLSWTEPVTIDVSTQATWEDCEGVHPLLAPVTVRSGWIPLEIGTTQASRTLLHVREEGGVARWPYGSDWIWVFLNMEHRWRIAAVRRDAA